MAIGGKMYLARLERESKRFNYSDRIKAARKQQRQQDAREARSALGASVFSTNSSAGQQKVGLILEAAYQRVMQQLEGKANTISAASSSINKLV